MNFRGRVLLKCWTVGYYLSGKTCLSCRWDTQKEVTVLIGMKKIGIMENGGAAAAVTRERRDRIAVHGRTSAADTITLKHLIGKEGS